VGFWAVASTFLTLAAFTTVPSPLYGLYQARDGFSELTLTVVFAAYAVGVIGALAPISTTRCSASCWTRSGSVDRGLGPRFEQFAEPQAGDEVAA
jgi:hypothetical protein